jgi:ribonuclease HII
MMVEYAKEYPKYKFEEHKGYGSPLHIEAIEMFGLCPLHRTTFLTKILSEPSVL